MQQPLSGTATGSIPDYMHELLRAVCHRLYWVSAVPEILERYIMCHTSYNHTKHIFKISK